MIDSLVYAYKLTLQSMVHYDALTSLTSYVYTLFIYKNITKVAEDQHS